MGLGPLDWVNAVRGVVGAGLDMWGRGQALNTTQQYYHPTPGTGGTLSASDNPDWSTILNQSSNPDISSMQLGDIQTTVPYGSLYIEQQANNQRSLADQRQWAQQAKSDIQGTSIAAADADLKQRIARGGLAIDQSTMEQIVGALTDQANAAAASQKAAVQQSLARSGVGAGQTAQLNLQASLGNAASLEAARRQAMIDQAKINADYGLALDQAANTVGGNYAGLLANADYNIANTYQPVDWAGLADIVNAWNMAGVNAMNEQYTGIANAGQAQSDAGLNSIMSNVQSRRMAEASNPSLFNPMQTIGGGLVGGLAGMATGNPLAALYGAGLGVGGGLAGNPSLGLLSMYGLGGTGAGGVFGGGSGMTPYTGYNPYR